MERPTREVKLPNSKVTAYIAQYYTHGEKKIVEAAQYKGATIKFMNGDSVFENISHNFIELKDDAMLEQGIKKLVDETGRPIDVNVAFFDTLAESDIQILVAECRKSYAGKGEEKKTS